MKTARGIALIPVLALVLVLSIIVTLTIVITGQERGMAGKQVHNQTLLNATESALQYGRAYMASKAPWQVNAFDGGVAEVGWNNYLYYFVNNPAQLDTAAHIASTITAIQNFDPKLVYTGAAGYSCFIYARDDMDEFSPAANDPTRDNNGLIYVGAVCTLSTGASNQGSPLVAELSSPLIYAAAGKY
jgi:hypothetical protein